jgi:hypothetical protein
MLGIVASPTHELNEVIQMRKGFIAAFEAFLSARGNPVNTEKHIQIPQVIGDGLILESEGVLHDTWFDPSVDFRKYRKIVLIDGRIEYRDNRRISATASGKPYQLGVCQQDRERFEQLVGNIFSSQLVKGSRYFTLATHSGPDTLILRGHVLDVGSTVPPPLSGSARIYNNCVDEVTLMLELFDGESGKPLVAAVETRALQPQENQRAGELMDSSVTAWRDVSRWAALTGSRLAHGLDSMYKRQQ